MNDETSSGAARPSGLTGTAPTTNRAATGGPGGDPRETAAGASDGDGASATGPAGSAAPGPREAQRQRTRQAILDATLRCLVEDGYATLTTRRIAERAGVAQSTLMHHFETREQLLAEAVANLAVSMAERAVAELSASSPQGVDHRGAVLDQAWATLTTPEAMAAAELLGAAWSEPELAEALRDLEVRIAQIVLETAFAVFPEESADPRFAIHIDAIFQTIRGLIMSIPTWGREAVEARWALIRPVLLEASTLMVPPPE